jgi:hypothetical protein
VFDQCINEVPVLEPVDSNPAHTSACWLSHSKAERDAVRVAVTGESLAS